MKLFILLLLFWVSPCISQRRFIVDVDSGIDDFQALVILLNADARKEIKIEAIICTHGNTNVNHVRNNVMRLLQTVGRTDIDVFLGSDGAILPHETAVKWYGADGFGDITFKTNVNPNCTKVEKAPIALEYIIGKNPDKVSILCLGPLTNLALALRMFQNLSGQINEIFIMGGNYNVSGAEFNFKSDPEAASIVLCTANTSITLLTWQACESAALKWEWRSSLKISNPVWNLMDRAEWSLYGEQNSTADYYSCDSVLAYAVAISRDVILLQSNHSAVVELHDDATRGEVFTSHKGGGVVTVIETVDSDKFKSGFEEAFEKVCEHHTCLDLF